MNVCIIGYGAIGPVHAEALSRIDNVNIYGICDIVPERARKGAQKYGAKAFYAFDECINDDNIDFIHICTPHYLHFEMITKALECKKRVVVEKPAVMTRSECDILFEKYDVSRIFPVLQNRSNACIEKLKDMSNSLGALKGIKGILTWSRDADYYNSESWRGTRKYEGGGVLINQAVHLLDLMIYFAGGAKSIRASMHNNSLLNVIEVEDTAEAYIKFKNGASGIFYATNAYSLNSPMQLELDFENAYAIYNYGRLYVNDELICSDFSGSLGKAYWGNGHLRVISDLYKNGSNFNLADIRDTMDAMFAVYESAKQGKEILL
ncbi:MAG: Gfo/Idh/MocA family oxidoreductase [Clostridiales bacterium]|nr:Gfo/Idh/MocA family oxidoreductase [Clostridiales bacterium]